MNQLTPVLELQTAPKKEKKSKIPCLDNLIIAFAEITSNAGCVSNNCFSCINDQCSTDSACCCDSR